jgi:hypothetical protein
VWLHRRSDRYAPRGESFLRVHWVAVPKEMRARRVNIRSLRSPPRCARTHSCGPTGRSRLWSTPQPATSSRPSPPPSTCTVQMCACTYITPLHAVVVIGTQLDLLAVAAQPCMRECVRLAAKLWSLALSLSACYSAAAAMTHDDQVRARGVGPEVGEHTEAVLRERLPALDVGRLTRSGVIGAAVRGPAMPWPMI